MLVRLLGKLWVNRMNIPLHRFEGGILGVATLPVYFVTQTEVCGYNLKNKERSRKF